MSIKFNLGHVTVSELADAIDGKIHLFGGAESSLECSGIEIDSRKIEPGDIFVAIKGERVDGNDYIINAVDSGAVCVIAHCLPDNINEIKGNFAIVTCTDPTVAVGDLAHSYKKRRNIRTVGVTGSVGKTTTKELIYAVLSEKYKVHKTEGNHNNELGLPLSILGMASDAEAAVLEMGMSGFGEIARLSEIAEPDFGVITTIGSSHIETLGSRENICKAKMEIVEGMKEHGELVLCGDEPLLYAYRCGRYNSTYISVYNNEAEFRAVNVRYADNTTTFDLLHNREVITNLQVPALGLHHVYSALFAYAIGVKFGLDSETIRCGFLKFKNASMRQSIYEIGGVKIIDACYNASPESMRASIEVLCELSRQSNGARKMALLGDMRELGAETRVLHEAIGEFVAQKKLDKLFTYGVAASFIASSAVSCGMKQSDVFDNPDITDPLASGKAILGELKKGDIILFKASRAMAVEKILSYLRENENDIRG